MSRILVCKAATCPILCSSPPPPPSSPPVKCKDNNPQFCQHVSSDQDKLANCKQHPYNEHCKLTCGLCLPAPSPPPPSTPIVTTMNLGTLAGAAETSSVSVTLIGGGVAAVMVALLACLFLASRCVLPAPCS